MNIVQKWVRQVAAIDESVLRECPEADRNWANHIGYALMLTFVVVFGLVFYSLLTIDGVKVAYDVQTNAVKMDSNSHELWSYVRFGVVATVVALVIFFSTERFTSRSGVSIYAKWTQRYADIDLYLFDPEHNESITIEDSVLKCSQFPNSFQY